MKTSTLKLVLLSILLCTGCTNSISPSEDYTTNLEQAKKWFTGKWQLTKASSQTINPNPSIPDVQLIIVGSSQVAVIENGQEMDRVNFQIVETPYNLQLITNAQPRSNNWYVRNPALRISSNKLFLDTGMAVDLPNFEFERVK